MEIDRVERSLEHFQCSVRPLHYISLKPVIGIEPTSLDYKTSILPLDDTGILFKKVLGLPLIAFKIF